MSAPTLLLAFDGSSGAAAAVRAAGSLFPGAAAVVANVQRDPATLRQAAALARIAVPDAVIAGGLAALDRAAEEESEAVVAQAADVASAAGLRAVTRSSTPPGRRGAASGDSRASATRRSSCAARAAPARSRLPRSDRRHPGSFTTPTAPCSWSPRAAVGSPVR
jgi:hypothetical protein